MPKISVLVPIYNVEKYLEQCLESICNQSFTDFEVICIDDGSTDQSAGISDSFAERDNRIHVIHKQNSGYGKSMNVGLQHAVGEYIAIVESDDFVEKDMLEKLYQAAQQSGADVTRGRYYRHHAGEDIQGGYYEGVPVECRVSVQSCPMLFCIAETIWTGLYRRSFLERHRIRFHETEGASFQDISFALQCWLCGGTAYFIDDTVIHYRIDNPGSSMKNPTKIFCVFDEYGWIEEMFRELLNNNSELDKYFVAMKYRDFLNHYFRVGEQYQYALLVRLQENLKNDMQLGRVDESAFLPRVWNSVKAIQEDRNAFFAKTTKNKKDDRLVYCNFMNQSIYEEAFINSLKKYKGIIIYGAGIVGKKVAAVLVESGCTKLIFAVSDNNPIEEQYMGYPVKPIVDLIDMKDDYAVVLAVSEDKQYEMYLNLERLGYANIFRVDDIVRKYMN